MSCKLTCEFLFLENFASDLSRLFEDKSLFKFEVLFYVLLRLMSNNNPFVVGGLTGGSTSILSQSLQIIETNEDIIAAIGIS